MSAFPALSKHDASRLPCGELEKWVFSTDRRKLLTAKQVKQPGVDPQDTKDDDTVPGAADVEAPTRKTLFVAGSEDEWYYTMLQIDNEIAKESLKNDACDKDKLNQWYHEFGQWVTKAKDKWPEHARHSRMPSRLSDLIFRNRCRSILDVDDVLDSNQLKAVDEIEKQISPTYEYPKPRDPSKGVYASQSQARNYKEFITETDLQQKFEAQMTKDLTGYPRKNVSSKYKTNALPWLIKQKLSLEQTQNILENYHNKLLILGGTNQTNEDELMQWILDDLKDSKYDYPRFGFRTVHNQLSLAQLDELKTKKTDLLSVSEFIQTYLKKLMPLELGIYIGKNWLDEIPIQMRWKFIKTLYGYANGSDLNSTNGSTSNSIRGYIYFQFMMFIEQNYYLLNKEKAKKGESTADTKQDDDDDEDEEVAPREGLFDGAYDLEAIIRYLLIPKSTSYNAVFRDDWYKLHDKT
eukprot:474761_1